MGGGAGVTTCEQMGGCGCAFYDGRVIVRVRVRCACREVRVSCVCVRCGCAGRAVIVREQSGGIRTDGTARSACGAHAHAHAHLTRTRTSHARAPHTHQHRHVHAGKHAPAPAHLRARRKHPHPHTHPHPPHESGFPGGTSVRSGPGRDRPISTPVPCISSTSDNTSSRLGCSAFSLRSA